jgi:hypothetical protein
MPASFEDILNAFEFVSLAGGDGNQAFLCRQSGRIYWHSEFGDNFEELPDDIEDGEKYVQLPDKRALDLGKALVLDFASEFMPDDLDEVRRFFSKRGAYGRFKDLLQRKRMVQRWRDFENQATEKALREWCADNSIEVGD